MPRKPAQTDGSIVLTYSVRLSAAAAHAIAPALGPHAPLNAKRTQAFDLFVDGSHVVVSAHGHTLELPLRRFATAAPKPTRAHRVTALGRQMDGRYALVVSEHAILEVELAEVDGVDPAAARLIRDRFVAPT